MANLTRLSIYFPRIGASYHLLRTQGHRVASFYSRRWLTRARLAHYAERFFFLLFYPADRSRSYLPVLPPLLVGQPVKMVTKNDHHAGSRWNVWRWTDVADAAGCGEDRRRASCLTIVYFFRHSEEPGRMWLASFAPTMTTTAGAQEHFKEPGSGKSQTGRRRLSSRTHSGGCLNSFIRISVLCTSCWGSWLMLLLRCTTYRFKQVE